MEITKNIYETVLTTFMKILQYSLFNSYDVGWLENTKHHI
jgi:hypothetical protein